MEIERKYLTKSIPFDIEKFPKKHISQCYISTSPTIRIRKSNENYFLTIKGKGAISKEEYEISITKDDYEKLLLKAETPEVIKTRYIVPLCDGLNAEIDVYDGKLKGLITTEVEFETMEEMESFTPPHWFGKDVSEDMRYKNTSLSIYGIPKE